jgi:hypothetical protein
MSITLYAATIPSQLQILHSIARLIDKAEEYCTAHNLPPEDIIQARIAPDMFPFAYQVKSVAGHSIGAIQGVRKGSFSPDLSALPETFAEMRILITDAIAALEAIDPAELESFIGQDMKFEFRDMVMEFDADQFLLSFSQPNFYFHAVTAYDILRMKGLEVGKRDFNGRVRRRG